jgi:hypothetical protein
VNEGEVQGSVESAVGDLIKSGDLGKLPGGRTFHDVTSQEKQELQSQERRKSK